MAGSVFISYSHRDQEFVSRLALDLERRGARVWIDREDIHAGEKWRDSIEQGIQECAAFLLVVSPEWVKSAVGREEYRMAASRQKPVLPLLYRKATIPADVAAELRSYQYLDFGHGAYGENLADLVASLASFGVDLHAAFELTPDEIARRNRERLMGEPGPTPWGAVLARVPGWAFAWALGWLVIGAIAPIAIAAGFNRVMGSSSALQPVALLSWPPCTAAGGFVGGLLAGLFTMLALRRNAPSIGWKHMSMAIRIWAFAGTLVCLVAFGVLFVSSHAPNAAGPVDCTGLNVSDCLGKGLGQAVADVASEACFGVFILLIGGLFTGIGFLVLGMLTGAAAVRRIRRLEPGILGGQALWVVLGWGLGSLLSVASALYFVSLVTGPH